MRAALTAAIVLASAGSHARADIANNELIHAHVDALVAADPKTDDFADRFTLSAGALVPILGTYRVDRQVFGEVRPSAIIFDWVLGGAVPAALVATELAVDDRRHVLLWTALGLYAATRVGVLVIANWHVSEYNHYLRLRLGAVATASAPAPAVVASWSW